ncbi:MAG: response regulator [Nitrospirales bacterium]
MELAMGQGARICVVDDEPEILRLLRVNLEGRGYEVIPAESGGQALQVVAHRIPDLFVVDLRMPVMDGLELTRQIRSQSSVPIIVLSGLNDEQAKVEALEQGADDYVTKPFGVEELVARIRSALRRASGGNSLEPVFASGPLTVNFERREARVNGHHVRLTPIEYDLLKYMIQHSGKPLTHRMMLTAVWGPGYDTRVQYLRVFVGQLRKKLEQNPSRPQFILTDPGIGYRFCAEAPVEEKIGQLR